MGYSLHGLALDRPPLGHQRIARNIVLNYYNRQGFTQFEPFQDSKVDLEDNDGAIPDVVFFDTTKLAAVAIEISTNKEIEYGLMEIPTLFACSPVTEVFVLDYETDTWYCSRRREQSQAYLDKISEEWTEEGLYIKKGESYSEVLGIDLKEYTQL